MHDFIHTDWYQQLFSEPAPFRWLWRLCNVWVTEDELSRIPEDKIDAFIGHRLLPMVHEVSYRKRRNVMRGKIKYTASFHQNKAEARAFILKRDGDRCAICHRKLGNDLSLDHIDNTPLPDGSLKNDFSNMRLTHALCNSRRGTHQNRKQNRAWKKATRAIVAIHGGDPHMLGRADRPPKRKRKPQPSRVRNRNINTKHINENKKTRTTHTQPKGVNRTIRKHTSSQHNQRERGVK